jgi:hypothetical protein
MVVMLHDEIWRCAIMPSTATVRVRADHQQSTIANVSGTALEKSRRVARFGTALV